MDQAAKTARIEFRSGSHSMIGPLSADEDTVGRRPDASALAA